MTKRLLETEDPKLHCSLSQAITGWLAAHECAALLARFIQTWYEEFLPAPAAGRLDHP